MQCRWRQACAPAGSTRRPVRWDIPPAGLSRATVRAADPSRWCCRRPDPTPLAWTMALPTLPTGRQRFGPCCRNTMRSTPRLRRRACPPSPLMGRRSCTLVLRASGPCLCWPAGLPSRRGEGARSWPETLLPRRRYGSAAQRGRKRAQIACWRGVGVALSGSGPPSLPPQWMRKRDRGTRRNRGWALSKGERSRNARSHALGGAGARAGASLPTYQARSHVRGDHGSCLVQCSSSLSRRPPRKH